MANESVTNLLQLARVASSIKHYIDNSKTGTGEELPDLSQFSSVLKGTITMSDLNKWEGKNMTDNGLWAVVDSNGTTMGIVVVGSITTVAQAILYIGPTATAPGTASELKTPATSGYSKQPGLSFAVRFNVFLGTLFFGSNIPNGLSDWHVMTIADYKNGFQLGGSSSKEWKGTRAEYDALATKDATTIYYILK